MLWIARRVCAYVHMCVLCVFLFDNNPRAGRVRVFECVLRVSRVSLGAFEHTLKMAILNTQTLKNTISVVFTLFGSVH